MKVEYGERDLVRPGRSLLQPDAVARAAEEVARSDQVAVPRRLELQPRAVPDERVQAPKVKVSENGYRVIRLDLTPEIGVCNATFT